MKFFFSRRDQRPETTPAVDHELALALHSDVGPVRERNEDCIAALSAPRLGDAGSDRTVLVALADGMGGHQAGELASRLAVQAALASFGRPGGDTVERLHRALVEANQVVFAQSRQNPQLQGMGTTLVLLAPTANGVCFAWVGDSRLYRWRDGALMQLTRDDTVVRGLLDRGLIGPHELAGHPDHSVLTQAVGTHAAIASPHVEGPVGLALGDRYLLCSDGVHDVLTDAELQRLVAAGSPREAVQRILAAALRSGANDNLSIGVVDVLPIGSTTGVARSTRHDIEALP